MLSGLAGKCQQSCKHLPGTCQLDQMALSDSPVAAPHRYRAPEGGGRVENRRERAETEKGGPENQNGANICLISAVEKKNFFFAFSSEKSGMHVVE